MLQHDLILCFNTPHAIIYRMNNLDEQILYFLKNQKWPITTKDIAKVVNITWNTAEKHLLKLYAYRRIRHKRIGGRNLWMI